MQIFIKLNRLRVIEVNPKDSIEDLHEHIMDKEGLPKKVYYLTHRGKVLSEGTLEENNIVRESTIHINIRLCSG